MTPSGHTESSTVAELEFFANENMGEIINTALESVRQHLGMDVAYLSEFVGGQSVFRNVRAPGLEELISVGDSQNLDDVYCRHILEGRLPELIPDTAKEPIAAALPITAAVPIGSHVSLPIVLPDGKPYGMFCCLSAEPKPTLNARDLQTMRLFATLVARQVSSEYLAQSELNTVKSRIDQMLDSRNFSIVYQPIVRLKDMKTLGYEALTRFVAQPMQTPDVWFNEAATVGLAAELETAAIRQALQGMRGVPDDMYISINASPATIITDCFREALQTFDLNKVVLEITEHAEIPDYDVVAAALSGCRRNGLRIAVDDAGAGHASFRHIIQLAPDFIKLDMSLTRNVDSDLARRALVSAMIYFTQETDALIIAEGIETAAELETLTKLGVRRGQGYFIGRPGSDYFALSD